MIAVFLDDEIAAWISIRRFVRLLEEKGVLRSPKPRLLDKRPVVLMLDGIDIDLMWRLFYEVPPVEGSPLSALYALAWSAEEALRIVQAADKCRLVSGKIIQVF